MLVVTVPPGCDFRAASSRRGGDPLRRALTVGLLILSPVVIHLATRGDGARAWSKVTDSVTSTVLSVDREAAADRLGAAAADLRRAHRSFADTLAAVAEALSG